MEKFEYSRRIYVQIKRKDIALFKFLLESRDNLAYLTVIDKYRAVVQVVCGYGFEDGIDEFLSAAGQEMPLKVVWESQQTAVH
ncbi:MAG: DUF4911 domain-containing protein [Desulfonatronovibrio sp. MSAO_Bac4]|nr:MAG: DUF4911 domain-containing protein [Desulfonatronovibrio sp. MSAO_Bac4]